MENNPLTEQDFCLDMGYDCYVTTMEKVQSAKRGIIEEIYSCSEVDYKGYHSISLGNVIFIINKWLNINQSDYQEAAKDGKNGS